MVRISQYYNNIAYCIMSAISFLLNNERCIAQGNAEGNIVFLRAIKIIFYKAKCNIYFIISHLCVIRQTHSKTSLGMSCVHFKQSHIS